MWIDKGVFWIWGGFVEGGREDVDNGVCFGLADVEPGISFFSSVPKMLDKVCFWLLLSSIFWFATIDGGFGINIDLM